MWTTVYMADGLKVANEILDKLKAEGFLVKMKPFVNDENNTLYEILVPEFEAEEIQGVLLDLGY